MATYYGYPGYINAMRRAEYINTKVAAYNARLYLDKIATNQARQVFLNTRYLRDKRAGHMDFLADPYSAPGATGGAYIPPSGGAHMEEGIFSPDSFLQSSPDVTPYTRAAKRRMGKKGVKRVVKQKAAGQINNTHPWLRKTRAANRGTVGKVLNQYHPKFKKLIPKTLTSGRLGGKWGLIAGGTAAALGLGYGAYKATRPKKQPWYRSKEVHAGIGALTGSLLGAGAGNTIAGQRGRLPGAAAGAAGGGYLAYTQSDTINKFLDRFGR